MATRCDFSISVGQAFLSNFLPTPSIRLRFANSNGPTHPTALQLQLLTPSFPHSSPTRSRKTACLLPQLASVTLPNVRAHQAHQSSLPLRSLVASPPPV